jgi:hypothetical protein
MARRGLTPMARLPSEEWLIQLIGGEVVLFREATKEEVVRFDLSNLNQIAQAQKIIHNSDRLTAEDKCFAHFCSGYLYACADQIIRESGDD